MSRISNYPPNSAYTLRAEVDKGKNITFSHGNMQFKVQKDGIISPYQSFICRYHNILNPYIIERTYTDEEFINYYQRPKVLSQDLYGTPELWSGLLYINNVVSTANFTNKTVKVFTSNIIEVLNELMTIYHDDIEDNQNTVYN